MSGSADRSALLPRPRGFDRSDLPGWGEAAADRGSREVLPGSEQTRQTKGRFKQKMVLLSKMPPKTTQMLPKTKRKNWMDSNIENRTKERVKNNFRFRSTMQPLSRVSAHISPFAQFPTSQIYRICLESVEQELIPCAGWPLSKVQIWQTPPKTWGNLQNIMSMAPCLFVCP